MLDIMPAPPSRQQALDAVRTLLAYIGEDVTRPGILDTPERVVRAWETSWGAGYRARPPVADMRRFHMEQDRPLPDQMVVVSDIDFFSTCEHHLAPFFGQAHIAYIPSPSGLLGLSKFARVVNHFSRRLQMQERLTEDIANCLQTHLSPDVAVSLTGIHLCMLTRGVQQPHAKTTTTALRGRFRTEASARAEFLSMVGKGSSK